MERTILHIVGGNSRDRAEQARIAFALGHHAEVYAELAEIIDRPPTEGLILVADEPGSGGMPALMDRFTDAGVWLPVIATSPDPAIERVVAAIKAGALDFLALPLEMGHFARRLEQVRPEAAANARTRRGEVEARRLVATLSRRESEVLASLSGGHSNKEIARELDISPRTVEIHRANMMGKLGAGHPADAVRLWLAARGDPAMPIEPVERSAQGGARLFAIENEGTEPATGRSRKRQRQ